MKKLMCLLGSLFILVGHLSLQSMEEQEEPLRKRRRRIELPKLPIKPKVVVPSLQRLTTKVTLDTLLKAENIDEILAGIRTNNAVLDFLKKEIEEREKKGGEPLLSQATNELEVKNIVSLNRELNLDNNARDRYGQTPFNALINHGRLDLARYLLEILGENLDVSTPDRNGVSPLQRVIEREDAHLADAITELMIQQGKGDVLEREKRERTEKSRGSLLNQVTSKSEIDNILDSNRKSNLDNNAQDQYGQTPFNALINRGRLDLAEYLLETLGKNLDVSAPDTNGVTPLQRVVKRGDTNLAYAIIRLMIQQGKEDELNSRNRFNEETMMLVTRNTLVLLPFFINGHVEPDEKKLKRILTILKKKKALQEALYVAVFLKNLPDIMNVIKLGADINKLVPVFFAGGNLTLKGLTLLQIAIIDRFDLKNIQDLVIEAGADVNATDERNGVALAWATLTDNTDLVRFLIEQGAKLDTQDDEGGTALMVAVTSKSNAIISLLLGEGVNVDIKDNEGNTALMWAILSENYEAIPLLVDAGADITLTNKEGKTAYELAQEHGVPENYLKKLLPAPIKKARRINLFPEEEGN